MTKSKWLKWLTENPGEGVSKSILTKTDPNKKSTNARLAEILKECAQAEKISAKEKELATIGEEAEPESAVYLPDLNPKDKTQSFYPKRYRSCDSNNS